MSLPAGTPGRPARRYPFHVLWLALLSLSIQSASANADGPRYASPATQVTVERMITAHGGMARWLAAPTVSFLRKAIFAAKPDSPWILSETIEQGRRRLYQVWPENDILLASDGTEVWTVNWTVPFPPRFVAQIGFYFLNMPWITQDPGIRLEELGRGSHPVTTTEYIKVAMSFESGIGATPGDRYVLYIDPDSYLLWAIEYHVTYGALLDAAFLPPSIKSIGPFYHVNQKFKTVEGLTVPVEYTVHGQTGSRTITGAVQSWSFRKEFDETMMSRPPEAKLDTSSPRRRTD